MSCYLVRVLASRIKKLNLIGLLHDMMYISNNARHAIHSNVITIDTVKCHVLYSLMWILTILYPLPIEVNDHFIEIIDLY